MLRIFKNMFDIHVRYLFQNMQKRASEFTLIEWGFYSRKNNFPPSKHRIVLRRNVVATETTFVVRFFAILTVKTRRWMWKTGDWEARILPFKMDPCI